MPTPTPTALQELRRRLAEVLERTPTPDAINELMREYADPRSPLHFEGRRDPRLAALLKRAAAICDQDGPVDIERTAYEGLGRAIYEITLTGGTEAGRAELIEEIDLAIGDMLKARPNTVDIDEEPLQ